jgi:hypothetical protein
MNEEVHQFDVSVIDILIVELFYCEYHLTKYWPQLFLCERISSTFLQVIGQIALVGIWGDNKETLVVFEGLGELEHVRTFVR